MVTPTNCEHADRKHYSKGLCKPCYNTRNQSTTGREAYNTRQREYRRNRYATDPEFAAQCREISSVHTRALHDEAVAIYGDCCVLCESTDDLQIDHILAGGGKQLREMFSNQAAAFYRWLVDNEPYGYQILCGPCNVDKGSTPAINW